MTIDIPSLIGLIIRLFVIVVLFYACVKQADEVFTHGKDELTYLRNSILLSLTGAVIALVPTIIYQAIRAFGYDSYFLRELSTVTGAISLLGVGIFVILIYRFRIKDKEINQ